jgi:hypothetical protein
LTMCFQLLLYNTQKYYINIVTPCHIVIDKFNLMFSSIQRKYTERAMLYVPK